MTIRDRAAAALDATHFTNKGIKTPQVRDLLAAYLDGQKMKATLVRRLCDYLEMVAR